ncbi:hypothetical protein BH23THE1_BH23THE1_33160 [soil metagenome]
MNSGINLYNEAKKSVFFIYNLSDSQKLELIGSGFFLQFKIESRPNKAVGYMTTAKHVLLNNNGEFIQKFIIRLKSKSKESQFILIDLHQTGYFTHDDPHVDIVIIPYYPQIDLNDFRFIKGEMVLDEGLNGLQEGAEVFFTGLFIQYAGQIEIQPILRFGRLSMIPVEKIRIKVNEKVMSANFYLIECTSFGGNSGSPVILKQNGAEINQIDLAGLITGSFNQFEKLPYDTILKQNTGIAAVTPSYKLKEILLSSKVYDARQKALD